MERWEIAKEAFRKAAHGGLESRSVDEWMRHIWTSVVEAVDASGNAPELQAALKVQNERVEAANDRADAAECELRRIRGGSFAGMLDRT
jgi:hypothetical protein